MKCVSRNRKGDVGTTLPPDLFQEKFIGENRGKDFKNIS